MIGLIVQARMGSSRLPGKVMKKVRDKPLLYYSINQLKQCKTISKLIIATTTFKEDDIISDFVKSQNVSVFRGDAFDVLERLGLSFSFNQFQDLFRYSLGCFSV